MGDKRPHKLKPFLRHLESMLGQANTLGQQKVMHIAGDRALYN